MGRSFLITPPARSGVNQTLPFAARRVRQGSFARYGVWFRSRTRDSAGPTSLPGHCDSSWCEYLIAYAPAPRPRWVMAIMDVLRQRENTEYES